MTETLVDELYRLVLRREPDPEARRQAAARLADGTLSRAGLLADLVASPEFTRVRALEDGVVCVSTLEHVGSDQSVYGVEPGEGGIAEALAEIRRVLAGSGYALVTVPCGAAEDHGWFVQHDRDGWNDLFAGADLHVNDQELYVLGTDGWQSGDDDRAAYGERGPGASSVLCSELHPGRLRHEAVRRVRLAVTL